MRLEKVSRSLIMKDLVTQVKEFGLDTQGLRASERF